MKEFRIFGCPGTGKTTRLAQRDIPRAVEKYGPDGVMVISFTRAAAKEIKSRGIDVTDKNVGTLHSMCYRALGQPELYVKHIDKFNSEHPHIALSGGGSSDADDPFSDVELFASGMKAPGDELLAQAELLRHRMIPAEKWPSAVRHFHTRWTEWKEKYDYVDFTDLLEESLRTLPRAPGNPRVIFVDEAQDCSLLQLKLVRSWGLVSDWFVLCGDDDQNLYFWCGTTPDAFLNPPVSEDHKTVLRQSYRVPRRIHAKAMQLIQRVRRREPKEYLPRDAEGAVVYCDETYKDPAGSVQQAAEYAKSGKTVMFLTSCAYMLAKMKECLIDRAIPFHNPYRRKRTDWNPLANKNKDALLAFLDHGADEKYWSVPTLLGWIEVLAVSEHGLLRGKAKKAIPVLKKAVEDKVVGVETSRGVLPDILSPAAIEPALNRDLEWFRDNLTVKKRRKVEYALKVYRKHGPQGLQGVPKIIVGTIHSCKGGEADIVNLFPDISYAAWKQQMEDPEMEDALYRVFYVGMTRAREALNIMSPILNKRRGSSARYVEF